MILIIECGATKSDWAAVPSSGSPVRKLSSPGINISTMQMSSVRDIIGSALRAISFRDEPLSNVFMYLAGVKTDELSACLQEVFREAAPLANIEIMPDLLGAARAACGREAGIAAILGTGSNSCLFDGEKIIRQVHPGGFILGDEGGAATLGRLFISDFIKGLIPKEIEEEFNSLYPRSSYADIVESVYRSKISPSAYLGGFAPFILKHYAHPYIARMVDGNFKAFIERCLKQYDTDRYQVGVAGSFGEACKEIFSRLAAEEGIRISGFTSSPIDNLIAYHTRI